MLAFGNWRRMIGRLIRGREVVDGRDWPLDKSARRLSMRWGSPCSPTCLIANRGEIACRVVRTARRLGLRSVALATPADRGALHTRLADEAHEIGAGGEGYLDGEAIVALAKRVGAECVHPGYGFLSENADFAELCGKAGLVFVGPSPAAMRALGLKHAAKALMAKLGVPVAPGYPATTRRRSSSRRRPTRSAIRC